jgi:arginyl-tRNA synthetase
MVEKMKKGGFAYLSEGALVVDVKEETDTAPIPPCIILKSDGSAIYETTDLATLVQREQDYQPDRVMYVVDKRQVLHFERVFRCAKITGVVPEKTQLSFIGFGTVNGKDGKPFKTRSGGTMKLSDMLDTVEDKVSIKDGEQLPAEMLQELKQTIGLAAVKYGDLMNPIESNYIFDIDKFASFEGNTGPYILYTMVRIKSILGKLRATKADIVNEAMIPSDYTFGVDSERELALTLTRFSHTVYEAYKKDVPSILCSYIYEISNKFNVFYHDKKILSEENTNTLKALVALISTTLRTLEIVCGILGFNAPEKM